MDAKLYIEIAGEKIARGNFIEKRKEADTSDNLYQKEGMVALRWICFIDI